MATATARRAFSRREVFVAASVVAALAGLVLPAVQKTREAQARAACRHNLGRLALAAHRYHDARGRFPAGEVKPVPGLYGPAEGEYYSSWVVPLLPHLGEGARAVALGRADRFEDAHRGGRASALGKPLPLLACPSDALPPGGAFEYHSPDPAAPTYHPDFPDGRYDAVSSYGANWGTDGAVYPRARPAATDGVFHYNTRTRVADVADGAGCTVLFGERSHREPRWRFLTADRYPAERAFAGFGRWYTGGRFTGRQSLVPINYRLPGWLETTPPPPAPVWTELYCKRMTAYGSEHPGGCNLAMADGSVRFVAESITLPTLHALSTRSGGEAVAGE